MIPRMLARPILRHRAWTRGPALFAMVLATSPAAGWAQTPDVLLAQVRLQGLGLYSGPVDGKWGPQTAKAVQAFRETIGLPPSRQLDSVTLFALREPGAVPQCKRLNREVRSCLVLLMGVRTPSAGNGSVANACDDALRRCKRQCASASVYDFETGRHLDDAETDFSVNCEAACRRGRTYCDGMERDDCCTEFNRTCRRACPSSVVDFRQGHHLLRTTAEDECLGACRAGQRACEAN